MNTVLWIVLGIIIVGAVVLGTLYLPRVIAPVAGKTEQIVITNQGAYRIQGYEQFYNLQEEVASIDVKLGAYPAELNNRQQTECVGLLARRADTVRTYNQRARAIETTGQWRADNLPLRLEHNNTRECN